MNNKINLKIANHYGVNLRAKKLSEELSELNQAILKPENLKSLSEEELDNIIDEIADVEIVLSQLQLELNKQYGAANVKYSVDKRKTYKLLKHAFELSEQGHIEIEEDLSNG